MILCLAFGSFLTHLHRSVLSQRLKRIPLTISRALFLWVSLLPSILFHEYQLRFGELQLLFPQLGGTPGLLGSSLCFSLEGVDGVLGPLQGSRLGFPFLRSHDPELLIEQCLKTIAFFFFDTAF